MISVQFLQRSGAAPRRSLEWSFTYRIGSVPHFSAVKTVTQTVSEVNKYERGLESTETEVNIQE